MSDCEVCQGSEVCVECEGTGRCVCCETEGPSKPSQPSTASGEQAREWLRNHGNSWLENYADLFVAFAKEHHSFRLSAEAEKKAEKIAQRFLCTKEFSDYKNIVVAIKQILEAEHDIP
jgi:hypothetical protein